MSRLPLITLVGQGFNTNKRGIDAAGITINENADPDVQKDQKVTNSA